MDELGDALQTLDETRAGASDQVGIDTVDLVLLERGNAAPVRALVDGGRVATVLLRLGQDDVLRVIADDGLVRHLRIAQAAGIAMENVDTVGILQKLVA